MLRTEFHCHTVFSKDSLTPPARLVETCRRKGIERVIVGEEILTTRGELLAAFVTEEVPPMLTPKETIRRLRAQGAFISVSHPFDAMRTGAWREPDLLAIAPLVDAIEVFNSRCVRPSYNVQAAAFARLHNLAGTVG